MNLLSYAASSVVEIPLRVLSELLSQRLALHISDKLECRAMVRQLLGWYLSVDATDFLLNPLCRVTPTAQKKLLGALSRLANQEPLQYVLGSTYFAGNLLKVTPDVLIPRPETEEWVTFLMHRLADPFSILDIGTGSGCIAITLKQRFPEAVVEAIDISKAALAVAAYNAAKIGVQVHFVEQDVLTEPLLSSNWSLIVSNPPYVRMQEKAFMHANVLDYEPHLALFVNDADPLVFHRRIIQLAALHLAPNGILCLEINEALGEKIVDLLHCANFKHISLHKDMCQKQRWVMAVCERKRGT